MFFKSILNYLKSFRSWLKVKQALVKRIRVGELNLPIVCEDIKDIIGNNRYTQLFCDSYLDGTAPQKRRDDALYIIWYALNNQTNCKTLSTSIANRCPHIAFIS